MSSIKHLIQNASYGEFFDYLQYLLQDDETPGGFSENIAGALVAAKAAYRVVDSMWIAPLASQADLKVLEEGFEAVAKHGLLGARTHLGEAVSAATGGHWARSINASVDALEATVRTITGKNTFTEAMKEIEAHTGLHKVLGISIRRFYDFTSDEKGLRHSNAELEKAQVDEGDALYALGTCSAAISLLTHKAKNAGLLAS